MAGAAGDQSARVSVARGTLLGAVEAAMGFDFREHLVNDAGEYDEEHVEQWDDELLELFGASPEYQAFRESGGHGGFLGIFLNYARSYYCQTPVTMDGDDVLDVLLQIFPRKVSCPAESAWDIVEEQRAFWAFAGREFAASNAEECLKLLNDGTVEQLRRELSDSSNFGMAKSFFAAGQDAGFDLTTEAGLQTWVAAHNAGFVGSDLPPASVFSGVDQPGSRHRPKKASRNKRAKRKAVRTSRRRNRR